MVILLSYVLRVGLDNPILNACLLEVIPEVFEGMALTLGGLEEVVLKHPRGLLNKLDLLLARRSGLGFGDPCGLFDLIHEPLEFHVDVDLASGLGAILDLGCYPVIGQLGGFVTRPGDLQDPTALDAIILVEDLKRHQGRFPDRALFLLGYI